MSAATTPPVVLFTYNRPRHTASVLEALRRQSPAALIVFQDGLRAGHDPASHAEVSRLLDAIDFGNPRIVRRPANLGLAASIIAGVTEVLTTHETIVVLEDDCVPSACFLDFMSFALDRFGGDERVFSISGYALPAFPRDYPYDLCFSPLSSSWGWATWRDRWQKFDPDARGWQEMLGSAVERRRFQAPGTLFPMMLRQQMAGRVSSWAIRWYYTLYRHHGVCVWPLRSFVRNIGMDGSGEHGVQTSRLDVELCDTFDRVSFRVPPNFDFDPAIANAFRRSFAAFSLEALRRVLSNPRSWPRVARQLMSSLWM
jgi:Glycosyl transferase family 2